MESDGPLSGDDIERFVSQGFIRVDAAFDREIANAGCALLYEMIREQHAGFHPDDPATAPGPVVRLLGSIAEPFRIAANTSRLTGALDQLVGRGRWLPKVGLGTFPIRFPHPSAPDDDGWHIDGSYAGPDGAFWVNLGSRGRALLLLFLFTDVGPDDAPTRIRVGSHLGIPRLLASAGDAGTPSGPLARRIPNLDALPLARATGSAGDVYLCHPFLAHAADRHHGSRPRVIAQPGLESTDGQLHAERADGDYSPVERAIRIGLGREADEIGNAH
jgi:hypothetical protein